MRYFYITFRSVTYAQRGEQILHRTGVYCTLQRTPRILQERGCSYCLRIRDRDISTAKAALEQSGISYGKIYEINQGQPPREVEL